MVAPRVELESEERTHLGQSAILHIRWNPCTDRYFRAGTPQSTGMGQTTLKHRQESDSDA